MSSMMAALRRTALDLEALLLPVACLSCGAAQRDGAVLCGPCRLTLRPIGAPQCGRCGQTMDRWETIRETGDGRRTNRAHGSDGADAPAPDDRKAGTSPVSRLPAVPAGTSPVSRLPVSRCGFCRAWPDALAWAASAVWFDNGAARELTHALKYGGWRVAARPMADVIVRQLTTRLRESDVLVPVPLGKHRLRARGHNQAEELAAAIGERSGVPVRKDALRRTRETRTQTTLHPSERRANVAGAFVADSALRGRRVVIVDDVLTTGATLGAVAASLAGAGATQVGAVTFARAARPGDDG